MLEGDIRACFDSIGKSWLLENIPMDKVILKKFLEAGFIDKGTWYPTLRGSPQGSPLSPTLAVIALSGLEKRLKESFRRKDKVHAVIYADDFIVSGASKELLEMRVKPVIAQFLRERGLELSEEKTKVTHISDGFDFLGFNVRKYSNGKLLTKPSKANVTRFLGNIRGLIRANVSLQTDKLIRLLNPKIRGWANYYRHGVSSRTFVKVDYEIYLALVRWMRRRHARKGHSWLNYKYFRQQGLRRWVFHAKIIEDGQIRFLDLADARSVHIRRFPKIVGAASPFNPEYWEYFSKRARIKRSLLHLRSDVVL